MSKSVETFYAEEYQSRILCTPLLASYTPPTAPPSLPAFSENRLTFAELEEGSVSSSSPCCVSRISTLGDSTNGDFVWPVLFVGILNVFTDTALGSSLVPILPKELQLDEMYQSFILSSGGIAASICGIFFGWLSDVYGWFYILLWFYPMVITSSLLMLIANRSFSFYLLARIIAGFGMGIMYPSNLSMVSTTHPPHVRATAVGFTLAGDIGSLCGPTVGGFLYDVGGARLLFSAALGVCFFATGAFALFIFPLRSRSSQIVQHEFRSVLHIPETLKTSNSDCVHSPSHKRSSSRYTARQPQSVSLRRGCSALALLREVPLLSVCSTAPLDHRSIVAKSDRDDVSSASYSASCHVSLPKTMPPSNTRHQNNSEVSAPTAPQPDTSDSPNTVDSLGTQFWLAQVKPKASTTCRELKVFCNLHFVIRGLTLMFVWGSSVVLQVTLPYTWDKQLKLPPSRMGLLFSPHLILRVAACACATYVSDKMCLPLSQFISFGAFLPVLSFLILAIYPNAVLVPNVIALALLGLGVGVSDSCTFAWASSHSSHGTTELRPAPVLCPASDTYTDTVLPSNTTVSASAAISPANPVSVETSHEGQAFALMAVACDLGIFLVPIVGSIISEFYSLRAAYILLLGLSMIIFILCLYSGFDEQRSTAAVGNRIKT